jgi:hypothetical protein
MLNAARNKVIYKISQKLGLSSVVLIALAGPIGGAWSQMSGGASSSLEVAIYVLVASALCAAMDALLILYLDEIGAKPCKDPLKLCIPIAVVSVGGLLCYVLLGSLLKGMLPGHG